MIEIKNLSFSYSKKNLFNNLNLSLSEGKIYGLLGKNGSGKTTLFKLISGILFPDKGEISINGINSNSRSFLIYRDIFFYPEEIFIPEMQIKKFVDIYSVFYEKFNKEKFYSLLESMEIKPDLDISKLSLGMKKKFYLVFGLATESKIYLLDEPTIGLDIPSKSQFRKTILNSLNEEKLFIISSHQIKDFNLLLDEVIIIDSGNILYKNDMEFINENFGVIFLQKGFEENEGILYKEEVLNGSMCIVDKRKFKNENSIQNIQDIDLEILFNFIVNSKEKIEL